MLYNRNPSIFGGAFAFLHVRCNPVHRFVLNAVQSMILGSMFVVSGPVAAGTLVFSTEALIYRSGIDGNNVAEISNSGLSCFPRHLTIDVAQGRVYGTQLCTNQFLTYVFRVNLDGTNPETLIVGFADSIFTGIALDLMQNKMYFGVVNGGGGVIKSASIDGTNIETVVSGTGRVFGMAMDPRSRAIYWAETDNTVSSTGRIRCFNIETGLVTNLVDGLGNVVDVAIDAASNEIYFVDMDGKIQKTSQVTGGPIQDVLVGLSRPTRLALDTMNRQVYWNDTAEQRIQRAGLDGSNRESLLTNPGGLEDLEVIVNTVAIGSRTWTQMKNIFR